MRFLLVTLFCLALPAQAGAPVTSVRPVVRGADTNAAATALVTAQATIRPKARPAPPPPVRDPLQIAPTSDDVAANTDGVAIIATGGRVTSPRPLVRPAAILEKAMAKRRKARRGAVCGDVDLQGTALGRVPGKGACGIKNAVELRAVSGISLSQRAKMDCGTAKALKRWVERGVKPAFGSSGGGVVKLRVAAHYACRTRNNRAGAKLSEHAKGRAIDISGFHLADGTVVNVLKGWRSAKWSKVMRRIHKRACGPFGTVLGPNADRYHQDHFHMDTARYRSGSYCR